MNKRRRFVTLAALMALTLSLGSCGGCAGCGKEKGEESVASSQTPEPSQSVVASAAQETPAPTATPEPTPEPTATPEPVIDFIDLDSPTLEELQAALDNEQYVTVNLNGEILFGEGEEGMEKLKEALAAGQTESEIKVDVTGKYGEAKIEETLTVPAGTTLNVNGKLSIGAKGELLVLGTANNNGGMFLGTALRQEENGAFANKGLIVKPEHKHKKVVDAAVAATCTTDGLSKGSHCGICGEILEEQKIVPATGHKEVIDKAVAATCQSEGKTEGKHCANCGEVFVKQETVAKTAHSPKDVAAVASTCTTAGHEAGTKCSVCGTTLSGLGALPLAEHTVKNEPEVPASCSQEGRTAGKVCTVCGKTLEGMNTIAKKAHTFENIAAKEATCTEDGVAAGKRCTVCGYQEGGEVIAAGHDWVYPEVHPYEDENGNWVTPPPLRYCRKCLAVETLG